MGNVEVAGVSRDTEPFSAKNLGVTLSMPCRLVMVRHGESEANVIQKAVKKGKLLEFPKELMQTPDREIHLSGLGVEQAKVTGPWLREQYPKGFEVICCSDHVRARETAGWTCLAAEWKDVLIRKDPLLGERSWGDFALLDPDKRADILSRKKRDPLHTGMPNGELLLSTRIRARLLIEKLANQFSNMSVLIFTHGEFIEAFWSEIVHWSSEKQAKFFHTAEGNIGNCQVVEFSVINPNENSAEQPGKLRWVRSSNPWFKRFGDWHELEYRKFSPEELLEEVKHYPHLNFADQNATQ